MKESRTARPSLVVETPAVRSLRLVEFLVDTRAELRVDVRSGLRVLDAWRGDPWHQQEQRESPLRGEDRPSCEPGNPRPWDGLDLVALILDGVHIGEHCLIVALGIAADGQKLALGLWASD